MSDAAKLLLIDDDYLLLGALSRRFGRRGMRVHSTTDPGEAIELFHQLFDLDVIILDLGLPGVDGITLLRQFRLSSSIPIVVLTGAPARDQQRALEAGADAVFEKPAGRELDDFIFARLHAARANAHLGSAVASLRELGA